jgi:hypothetical protein
MVELARVLKHYRRFVLHVLVVENRSRPVFSYRGRIVPIFIDRRALLNQQLEEVCGSHFELQSSWADV